MFSAFRVHQAASLRGLYDIGRVNLSFRVIHSRVKKWEVLAGRKYTDYLSIDSLLMSHIYVK